MSQDKEKIEQFLEAVKNHSAYRENDEVREVIDSYGPALLKPGQSSDVLMKMMGELKQALAKVINTEAPDREKLLHKILEQYETRKSEWTDLKYEREIPTRDELAAMIRALPPEKFEALAGMINPTLVLASKKGKSALLARMSFNTGLHEGEFCLPEIKTVEFYDPNKSDTQIYIAEGADNVNWQSSPLYRQIRAKIKADPDFNPEVSVPVSASVIYQVCRSFGLDLVDTQQYMMLAYYAYVENRRMDGTDMTFLGAVDEYGGCMAGSYHNQACAVRGVDAQVKLDSMIIRPSVCLNPVKK